MAVSLIKSQFGNWDSSGKGDISRGDLATVFTTLNPTFTDDEIQLLMNIVTKGAQGNISFNSFIDGLFSLGATCTKPSCAASTGANVKGFRAPDEMTVDERCEVERTVSKALMECSGNFEGEYFPLVGSATYPALPDGMSQDTEKRLQDAGMLLSKADGVGCGIFVTNDQDIAVWVNGDYHMQIFVKSPNDADKRLGFIQSVVADALKQDGYFIA